MRSLPGLATLALMFAASADALLIGQCHAARHARALTATRPAHEAVVAWRLAAVGVEANNARPTDEASPLYVPVPNKHKAMVDKLLETVAVDAHKALTAEGAHCCKATRRAGGQQTARDGMDR